MKSKFFHLLFLSWDLKITGTLLEVIYLFIVPNTQHLVTHSVIILVNMFQTEFWWKRKKEKKRKGRETKRREKENKEKKSNTLLTERWSYCYSCIFGFANPPVFFLQLSWKIFYLFHSAFLSLVLVITSVCK